MSKPSIKTITVRNLVNFLLLASLVLLIITGLSFRSISHRIIKNKTLAISEVILAGVTAHMKADMSDKQDYFLQEIRSLHEVEAVSVLVSPLVSQQFEPGLDVERKSDRAVRQMYDSAAPVFEFLEFSRNPHVRALIPYKATREGSLNCLSCHEVEEDAVLGAVDIKLDLTAYRNLAVAVLSGIVMLASIFIVLISINTFRTIHTHIKEPLENLMVRASDAYFRQQPLDPESYMSMEFDDIARKFNMFNTAVLANQSLIKEKNQELLAINDEVDSTLKETVFTMGVIEEQRSEETRDHTSRVTRYCQLLATKIGLSEDCVELVTAASPLHDIGKLGIPDRILLKPDKLTEEEFEVIKNHTGIGYAMLLHSSRDLLKAAAIIAYQHHEKWDGTGYPQGLRGEEIHVYGRIVALADVFDALSSDRIYRPAWPDEKVINYITEEVGKHFDPVLVDIFVENLDAFLEIKALYKSPDLARINA
ncbi:MAG: HD domain-containing protein [bacterium]|nr:HD domain-containing protein [bacterium]